MASYNQKFNSDDSVIRHLIIGFLADLNNKVYFHRQLSNNERVTVDVPFYYSITGDDQFLRDQFLFSTASGPDCTPDKGFADGNYDAVPRGVANLSSMSIDSAKLVNKRTTGSYTKMNDEGAMEGYSSEFDMIPIVLTFDIEILVSSTLDSFKITESIIKRLYKSNYYNVEVGHLNEGTYRIASYYAFPEDYTQERPIEYTFEDKEEYKITFPIEINSFIPSFDFESERHVGNRMFSIVNNSIVSLLTEDGGADTQVITNKPISINPFPSAFNQIPIYDNAGLNLPKTNVYQRNISILNAPDYAGAPLLIIPAEASQNYILIAENGIINIDPSNFKNISSIVINNAGSIDIQYTNGFWYVAGQSNAIITYI